MKDYNVQFLKTLATYTTSLTSLKDEIARLEQEIKDRQATLAILLDQVTNTEKQLDDHIAATPVVDVIPDVVPGRGKL